MTIKRDIKADHYHVWIALGSNQNDRAAALRSAADEVVRRLHRSKQMLPMCSSVYETSPVGGPPGQTDFLNAVITIECHDDPRSILAELLAIERSLGRRRGERDGPREIDLDLLMVGDRVEHSDDLILPHPRLHLRRFVLQPACDIDPQRMHPVLGRTMGELLMELDRAGNREHVRRVMPPSDVCGFASGPAGVWLDDPR